MRETHRLRGPGVAWRKNRRTSHGLKAANAKTRVTMSSKTVTVSEVSALIEERERSRAELLTAYQQWCELEARVVALSRRADERAGAARGEKP